MSLFSRIAKWSLRQINRFDFITGNGVLVGPWCIRNIHRFVHHLLHPRSPEIELPPSKHGLIWLQKRRWHYPQTWWYVVGKPESPRIHLCQWFCGRFLGHELSDTEKGYGGGGMIDRWCRYCNKRIQIPIREEQIDGAFGELMDEYFGDGEEESKC